MPRLLQRTSPMMIGDDVRTLQQQLKDLGYDISDVDGKFGEETDRVVRVFQANEGLTVDGKVGDDTRSAIVAALERMRPESPSDTPPVTPIDPPPSGAVGTVPDRNLLINAFAYATMTLRRNSDQTDAVRDLQRHLRALGYLRAGIDGDFGGGTERAVEALQYDLMNNNGADEQGGSSAPVRITDYNKGRIAGASGVADVDTAACIRDLLSDTQVPLLPFADDPAAANARALETVENLDETQGPIPFLLPLLAQESRSRHFAVPGAGDEDTYITVGMDMNDAAVPARITSRGYGVGQHTLFHHPPLQDEVDRYMLDPAGNVTEAMAHLREKFDDFIVNASASARSDDRIQEIGSGPLRLCKYEDDDPRYMKDCTACMAQAGTTDIISGETPYYAGSSGIYQPTKYHNHDRMDNVPVRAQVGCDWPYAVRRYNGSGINSYWYQSEMLKRVAEG